MDPAKCGEKMSQNCRTDALDMRVMIVSFLLQRVLYLGNGGIKRLDAPPRNNFGLGGGSHWPEHGKLETS